MNHTYIPCVSRKSICSSHRYSRGYKSPLRSFTLREEHKEGKHQSEEANGFRQSETQNSVVEQHLGQVGLACTRDQQRAENVSNTHAHTGKGDGGQAGTDVVQALDGDGHRRGRASRHRRARNRTGGSKALRGRGTAELLSQKNATHHFDSSCYKKLWVRFSGESTGEKLTSTCMKWHRKGNNKHKNKRSVKKNKKEKMICNSETVLFQYMCSLIMDSSAPNLILIVREVRKDEDMSLGAMGERLGPSTFYSSVSVYTLNFTNQRQTKLFRLIIIIIPHFLSPFGPKPSLPAPY